MNPDDLWTLPSVRRDYVEWHRGRRQFALWAIDLARPRVVAACRRVQAALAPLLLPGYLRQPHLTLGWCGFPVGSAAQQDDFGPMVLRRQIAALTAAPAPFRVRLAAPESFSSAAYLAVDDFQGGIAQLRNILAPPGELSDFVYLPHVTCGLYRVRVPLREVRAGLAAVDDGRRPELRVNRVVWMTYEAAEISGALCRVAAFDLRTRGWRVEAPARMRSFFGPAWQTLIF